jgi:hypothetical protein
VVCKWSVRHPNLVRAGSDPPLGGYYICRRSYSEGLIICPTSSNRGQIGQWEAYPQCYLDALTFGILISLATSTITAIILLTTDVIALEVC